MELLVDFPRTEPCAPLHHRRLRVSFANEIEVKFVENLSYEHKEDLWFTRNESEAFKHRAAKSIRAITSVMSMAQYAELNVEETSAFLGLENYLSRETCREVKHRRQAVLLAVLSEQDRQERSGILDPEALAQASEAVSHLSRRRALIIGMIHADKKLRPLQLHSVDKA